MPAQPKLLLISGLAIFIIVVLACDPAVAFQVQKKEQAAGGLKHATIYTSKSKLIKYEALQEIAEASSAKIELLTGTQQQWESVKVIWSDKSLTITSDSGDDLPEHCRGFEGFVFHQLAGAKMDTHVFHIIKQIHRTNHLLGCVGEPALHDDSMAFISKLATRENAICFVNNSVWDNQLQVLLGPDNHRDEKAVLPVLPSAIKRRTASIELLKEKGIPTIDDLPVIVTDEEVKLRTAQQVARRAVCLMAVASQAEGRPDFSALEFLQKHSLQDELSPKEKEFLQDEENFKAQQSVFTWRYESLATLMWCLSHRNELPFPAKLQNPISAIERIEKDVEGFIKNAKLRSTKQILDENNLAYRCVWAGVSARRKGNEQEGMILSVAYERLYALNWITRLKNEDWDDVDTDS